MSSEVFFVLTLISALGSGLVAGIFFAFSTFIMKALGRLTPPEGIRAMQSINLVVINPWFLGAFFGTAVICLVLAVSAVFELSDPGVVHVLAGSALYLFGTILVTMVVNVPLNNALAAVQPDSAEGTALWTRYLSIWTTWNHVRTICPLLASLFFVLALC